ncbi:glycerate kinase [Aricia agestis]|uniref:glycerate kinase n=1 Tax=Aricia agestis TaxID=91739 RepID=UPI001C204A9F|nr:glycerate kinase [Aricia agestis]
MNRNIIADLNHIFRSCVSAVLPENFMRKSLNFNSSTRQLKIFDKVYELRNKNVYIVGTGKAVQKMANELEHILSPHIKKGIISIPKGSSHNVHYSNLEYYEGAENNLPDSDALNTATKVKQFVSQLSETDILFVLISGGGSALLPLPKSPITLEEKCTLIKKLANSGADIIEINTVRKRISDIKGGNLAIHAYPTKVVSLILSDIVGDPIDLIASGPTCQNADDDTDAIEVIKKYNLYNDLPESIKHELESPSNSKKFMNNSDNIIVGSNKQSIAAGMVEAKNLNYMPINLSNSIVGNIRDIANEYSKLVKLVVNIKNGASEDFKESLKQLNLPGLQLENFDRNVIKNENLCFILGGEITVEVKGEGKGGRNQQLALEFSKAILNIDSKYDIYMLSAGTDGIDGPTDAAGAIGYNNLIKHAGEAKLNVDAFLGNNDSYNFYKNFNNGSLHVITGHTNTNVMDIHLIIIKSR